MTTRVLKNYVAGEWRAPFATESLPVTNPTTGETIAQVPLSSARDIDMMIAKAIVAFGSWRQTPAVERARYLFTYKELLEARFEQIAAVITEEHGKTLTESRGDIRRGIENVEHACGVPALMMGDSIEDVAAGIDCETWRQPLGVFAAVTPFNFPAMVPLWFWPYAVATGNTFVVKPSEQTPLTQQLLFELIDEAGFPPGVINLIHGDKRVVQGLVEHQDIAGISFVGSTPVAQTIYTQAASNGKRVQALGGAKNHIVIMPDAAMPQSIQAASDSCFGCSGQRCLAGSTVVAVGDCYDQVCDGLIDAAGAIIMGSGLKENVSMGPVISAAQRDRIVATIGRAEAAGARVLLDGRQEKVSDHPGGFWLGPTILSDVDDNNPVVSEEVFGPVLVVRRADTLDDAIAMIKRSEFANATSLFTSSGKAARDFRYNVGVSMIGINVGVAAPMAFFPFGGTKHSFFGDLKAHGNDSIRFFTDAKTTITRWW